jgi:iron(III) transport system ATP-binding protein
VTIERLVKRYGGADADAVTALDDVSLTMASGELTVLLGPSGCGKTTLLRSLGGLVTPDGGAIHIGDQVVFSSRDRIDVATRKRHIGMVFQSYALWPNLSVFENVAFPLREQRVSRATIRARVTAGLELVGCAPLGQRYPHELSGGQQQRVALARALVAEPRLLLLDEPLSNLDAGLRVRMRGEIRRVQQRTEQTMVHVTHDQGEALALADRLVVMRSGRVVQLGTPREVYEDPRSAFVADFLGAANLLEVHGRGSDGSVETPLGALRAARDHHQGSDGPAYVAIRQEDVHVGEGPCGRGCGNEFQLPLQAVEYLGDHQLATVAGPGEVRLIARCPAGEHLRPGIGYRVCLPAERCSIVPS